MEWEAIRGGKRDDDTKLTEQECRAERHKPHGRRCGACERVSMFNGTQSHPVSQDTPASILAPYTGCLRGRSGDVELWYALLVAR